jgi:hypothetical protein
MNEDLFALEQVSNLPARGNDVGQVRERWQAALESAHRKGFTRRPDPDPLRAAAGALAKPAQLGRGRPSDVEAGQAAVAD